MTRSLLYLFQCVVFAASAERCVNVPDKQPEWQDWIWCEGGSFAQQTAFGLGLLPASDCGMAVAFGTRSW